MKIKLAENLKLLRKEKKLSQEEVAERFNVTSQSVSKWELGQSCPDITLLPEIADFYKVSIDELMGYTPMKSLNSCYLQIKEYLENIDDDGERLDSVYRICRLCATIDPKNSIRQVDHTKTRNSLISGDYGFNKSIVQMHGKEYGGVISHDYNSMLISSFRDLSYVKNVEVRELYKTLSKYANINVLKVLLAIFKNINETPEKSRMTIKQICEITKLPEEKVDEALNSLPVYMQIVNGEETWHLTHQDTIPLLILLNQGDDFFKNMKEFGY